MKQLIPQNTSFDFVGKSKFFIVLSLVMVIGSLYLWFSSGEQKFGIDFLGGYEVVVEFKDGASSDRIRESLKKSGIAEPSVQAFEASSNQFAIRLLGSAEGGTDSMKKQIEDALRVDFAQGFSIVRTDFVGPTVGEELRFSALTAVCLGLIGMLIYVAFRFELAFGVGAVAAIFHDVIVATGIYILFNHPINMETLAGALTIVGYSINDTIVVFDRIREEILKNEGGKLSVIVNKSINGTLSRTIITSLLTFFSAISLYLVGGGAISNLSFFLCVGLIVGSYSTIFIASPITIAWHKFRGGSEDV
jgi:preprotein translocase subunit SecF